MMPSAVACYPARTHARVHTALLQAGFVSKPDGFATEASWRAAGGAVAEIETALDPARGRRAAAAPAHEGGPERPAVVFTLPEQCAISCRVGELEITSTTALESLHAGQLAHVSALRIEHRVHGAVRWVDEVDLSGGMRFDRLVWFSKKSVEVYPADAGAPPVVGQGLNKPAIVSLAGCFPKTTDAGTVESGSVLACSSSYS